MVVTLWVIAAGLHELGEYLDASGLDQEGRRHGDDDRSAEKIVAWWTMVQLWPQRPTLGFI